MHDIENEVYTIIAKALREKFPDINLSGQYIKKPSSFPHVCIVQEDTYLEKRYWDNSHEYDGIMFEVSVYSNKADGKKSECKAIAREVSDIFVGLNFRRTSQVPVPNLEDASIYRIVSRFEAVTDGKYIYRR